MLKESSSFRDAKRVRLLLPLHALRRNLFVYLRRNSRPVTSSLGIPADALAKLGMEVPM